MSGFFSLSKKYFLLSFPLLFLLAFNIVSAQTDIDKKEAQLRAELEKIEEEQRILQQSLNFQKTQTATIQRDVNILGDQIRQAELNIQKKRLEIQSLGGEINIRNQTVEELNKRVSRSKGVLSELIKKTNDRDSYSLPEIILGSNNLSDFFVDLDSYNAMQKQLERLFIEIREIKGETEKERTTLIEKQNAERDRQAEIEASRATVAVKKKEQDTLLSASKRDEATYEEILKQKQAQAAAIRNALFQLRDSADIQFGDALKYAEQASKNTGVRAAFILGILKQESNIGQNVGSCIIVDLNSGRTQSVNSGNIFDNGIHPTRDLPVLQTIVKTLGRDPLNTRVSCPFSVGYGGAMGPSQFIPSTWQSYIPRLQQIYGVYPNPWNPEHAINASALFLRDLGAAAGGYSAEFEAAGRYYAGGNWQTLGQGYATSVMNHTAEMQKQIDLLRDLER